MTQFKETYDDGDEKLLDKGDLEYRLIDALECSDYYSGGEIEKLKSNLKALTKAFAELVVSKAVVGDHTAIRILTDNVYDVEVSNDN